MVNGLVLLEDGKPLWGFKHVNDVIQCASLKVHLTTSGVPDVVRHT